MSPIPFKGQIITHLFAEREHDRRSSIHAINPVDESEVFQKLCQACRSGDIATVQHLIKFENVNLNAVDNFDYPPLTLASLCGHYDVVHLLLESGALCERDTFQGERCLYSALTDKIRNLLLQYDFSKSIDDRQPFASHISSLLTTSTLQTSDVTVATTYHSAPLPKSTETPIFTKEFHLHKFLLAARSQYFRRKLLPTESHKKSPLHLRLPTSIDTQAFESTVRFLYLGEVTELFSPEITANIDRLSTHLDLPSLWEFVLASSDPKQRRLKRMDEVDKAQDELESWFEEFVLAQAVRLDFDKLDTFHMDCMNSAFADVVLRADEDEHDRPRDAPLGWEPQVVFYPVHKAMLRSEFFKIMFTSAFREGQKRAPDEPLDIIPLEFSPRILELVLRFLYSDKVAVQLEDALDTLYAAEQLLIERLKTKTVAIISTMGNAGLPAAVYNVYDVVRAGWDTRQKKLEEFGAKYIAERFENYINDPEFAHLVTESAERIKDRQETDTIELIDDIRYYLDQRFRMRMDNFDAEEMFDDDPNAPPQDIVANGNAAAEGTAEEAGLPAHKQYGQVWTEEELQADFMRVESLKYAEFLGRIDELLQKLNLDA